jgi:putative endonuclease
MSDPRHTLGLAIESRVADWLRTAGWTILSRRARAPSGGEVDIVAIDTQAILVAVEVRARRTARTGSAAESVDRRRVDRLRRTLAAVAPTAPPHAGLRVDLVTAEPIPGVPARWRLRRTAGIDAA